MGEKSQNSPRHRSEYIFWQQVWPYTYPLNHQGDTSRYRSIDNPQQHFWVQRPTPNNPLLKKEFFYKLIFIPGRHMLNRDPLHCVITHVLREAQLIAILLLFTTLKA